MSRRSVGATVQWTESQSAAKTFTEGVIVTHPDNPNALLFASSGTAAAVIMRHPSNTTSLLITKDTAQTAAARILLSGGSGIIDEL